MRTTNANMRLRLRCHSASLRQHEHKVVDEIRDLGVTHDSKLTYEKHINNIVKKANKSMGFILRQSTQLSSIQLVKILYCSYVRIHTQIMFADLEPSICCEYQ
ncbi:unnamed protein product [Euphydryas editha]|uniref:Uncharacterized protein n=1 Tax=Euphydryas editha TaxID=104508 RepID=A0AAU9V634_EUPED|nr:unnamed protein product [Euphydryas editha]